MAFGNADCEKCGVELVAMLSQPIFLCGGCYALLCPECARKHHNYVNESKEFKDHNSLKFEGQFLNLKNKKNCAKYQEEIIASERSLFELSKKFVDDKIPCDKVITSLKYQIEQLEFKQKYKELPAPQ